MLDKLKTSNGLLFLTRDLPLVQKCKKIKEDDPFLIRKHSFNALEENLLD